MSRKALAAATLAAAMLAPAGCGGRGGVSRLEWTAMGTVAAVQTRGAAMPEAEGIVRDVFARLEELLNAHDPGSELSRLAPLDDAEVLSRCDPSVAECYRAAFAMADATGREFNPRWRGPGTLDLGAIAKGFALDVAAAALEEKGIPGGCDVLLDIGGNLKAVRGDWRVGILGGETISLKEGAAVATSGEYYRGRHIKSGATGADLEPDFYSVSVVHPSSGMLSDALSTALFVMGRIRGGAFLASRFPEASAVWTVR